MSALPPPRAWQSAPGRPASARAEPPGGAPMTDRPVILIPVRDPSELAHLAGVKFLVGWLGWAFAHVSADLRCGLSRTVPAEIARSAIAVLVLTADPGAVALGRTALQYLLRQGVQSRRLFAVLTHSLALEGLSRAEIERALGVSIVGSHAPYARGPDRGRLSTCAHRHEVSQARGAVHTEWVGQ
jgi:hypothetical protein